MGQMQQVCVWAPSNVGQSEVTIKINEWMRCHPTKPPYERFIQDHISSEWPVMWHLKSPFYISIDRKERKVVEEENKENIREEEICPICHNSLGVATETLTCRHSFHATCLHQWLRRSSTCPMCRHVV
jgi:hypothetical protein